VWSGPKRLVWTLVVFAALAAFYAATFDFRNLTDTDLQSRQTETFVRHGTMDLTGQHLLPAEFAFHHGGRLYSEFGVGISVVAAPMYAVLIRLGASRAFMQGATAIVFVTAATLILFRVLRSLVQPLVAAIAAVVFALGTPAWTIGTTALHEVSAVMLAQAIGLWGLFGRSRRSPLIAGLGFGFAAFLRPTQVVVAGLVGLFYLLRERRSVLAYIGGVLLPVAGILVQNRWLWGNWLLGGYENNPAGFHGNVAKGLFGLLFSWWRGVFVYTPVMVLAFVGLAVALRRRRDGVAERMILLGIASIALIGVYSRWTEWWGGTSQYGYRFLLEIVVFLVVLGAYAIDALPRLRPMAAALAGLSVLTMVFGMQPNRFAWDGVKFPHHFSDSPIGQAWIVFSHHPGGGVLRFCGVGVIGALFVMLARTFVGADRAEPKAA